MDKQSSTSKRRTLLTIPVLADSKAADIIDIKSGIRRTASGEAAVTAGFGFVFSFIVLALIAGIAVPFHA